MSESGHGVVESPTLSELTASPRLLRTGVLVLVALVYLPTLRFGFVYDDGWVILSNGFLRVPDLGVLFSRQAVAAHVPDAFRPVSVLFDILAYRMFGLWAVWHHAVSIALHLAVCRVVWGICEEMRAPVMVCVAATLLFGLMGIHAEVVAVVSFREDLLAALLGLSAVWLGIWTTHVSIDRAHLHVRVGGLVLAAALMALACGSKASAALLPCFFLLLVFAAPFHRTPTRTVPALMVFAALSLGVLAWLLQTTWVFGSPFPYGGDNPRILAQRVGFGPVLAASTVIHAQYAQQMLLPFGLRPEYVDAPAQWTSPAVVFASLGFGAAFCYAIWAGFSGRRLTVAVAVLGALVLSVPTSNLFGLPNMQAERFMYLPSVPVAFGLGHLCVITGQRIADRSREPLWVLGPALALGVIQGSAAYAATTAYASNSTLWRTAIVEAPGSSRAVSLRGLHLLAEAGGRVRQDPVLGARIEALCRASAVHDSHYELPEVCMGRLRVAQRRWSEAAMHFERALAVSPDRNDRILASLIELGPDLSDSATDAAQDRLERALSAYPYSPELHAAGGRLHHKLGHPDRAMALYRRARSLRPERWETVVAALELALDLGDAPSAQRTWLEEHELLEKKADPAVRIALARRLADARQRQDFSLLQSLLSPGVF